MPVRTPEPFRPLRGRGSFYRVWLIITYIPAKEYASKQSGRFPYLPSPLCIYFRMLTTTSSASPDSSMTESAYFS